MYVRQIFGGVYTSKIFDGCMSVKYLGAYTSKIIDGCMSVKYLGGLPLQNI